MNVHVQPLGQPATGSAKPGNLYADLQSRSLWLGVDPGIPGYESGSVLISDMVALMAEIADAEAAAKTYTDDKLLLYAPIDAPIFTGNPQAPTPLAADNDTSIATTAFVKAALAASTSGKERRYTVLMYAGDPNKIGSNEWAGWALCDGTSYPGQPNPEGGTMTVTTPDLRSKFVIGGGHIAYWPDLLSKNPSAQAPTQTGGVHDHGAKTGDVALSAAQIPAHSHTSGTLGGTISGTAATAGAHQHSYVTLGGSGSVSHYPIANAYNQNNTELTGSAGAHAHSVSGSCDVNQGSTANNTGGGGVHSHSIANHTGHTHVTNSNDLRDALPWYALAFVMKL